MSVTLLVITVGLEVLAAPSAGASFAPKLSWGGKAVIRGEMTEHNATEPERIAFQGSMRVRPIKGGGRQFAWDKTTTEGVTLKARIFRGGSFDASDVGVVTKVVADEVFDPGEVKIAPSSPEEREALEHIIGFYQRLRWHVLLLNGLAGRSLAVGETHHETIRIPFRADEVVEIALTYEAVAIDECPGGIEVADCARVRVEATYDSKPVFMAGPKDTTPDNVLAVPTAAIYEVTAQRSLRRPVAMSGEEKLAAQIDFKGQRVEMAGSRAKLEVSITWLAR